MANVSIESVSHIVGCIYEAAHDQERWLDVVTGMRDLLGGSRACIVRFGTDTLDSVSTISDPEFSCAEAVAMHLNDPLAALQAALPVGTVYRRAEIAGLEFYRRPLWQDWFRPRDMYDGLATNLFSSNGFNWLIDVHRGARQPVFDDADVELMQRLIPHVLRAGEISRNVEKSTAFASAFSHLPVGILVVGGDQRVHQVNDAAEAILARPDSPLRLKSSLVAVANPKDALELKRLVVDACSLADGATPGIGGTLLLPSPYDDPETPRLVLSVAPYFSSRAYGLASERCAVITIHELAPRVSDGFAEHFRIVFNLTKAEARLAASLAAGRSLKDAAGDQSIQFSTARYYLEQIFRKTATHRQRELVDLLKIARPMVVRPPS